MKKIRLFCALSLLIVCAFSFLVFADVGNTNNYDSGGYSGGSGGGYDSDFGGGTVVFFGDGEGGSSLIIPALIITALIVIAILKGKRKAGPGSAPAVYQDRTNDIEAKIMERDGNFSAEKILSYAQEVFVKLQEAWTKRDWKSVRVYESEQLYNVHETQLKRYAEQGQINVIDRVNVGKTYLFDYQNDGKTERINLYLEAQMIDYIMDEKTKKVLNGNPDVRCSLRYQLEFIRVAGVKTQDRQLSTTNCPNCGAPTEVTSAGQCEYCRSVITHGEHGWVLNKLEGIRN